MAWEFRQRNRAKALAWSLCASEQNCWMERSNFCIPRMEARWCVSRSRGAGCLMPDEKISVLLVDDHSLVRRGFRRMLEDESDISVVGEAADGEEAVKLARSLKPRVVIMDSALPGINGLEATRKILQFAPETLVLMLSMHSEDTWVRQALDAGARGYVLKNAMDLDLGSTIRRIVNGETV